MPNALRLPIRHRRVLGVREIADVVVDVLRLERGERDAAGARPPRKCSVLVAWLIWAQRHVVHYLIQGEGIMEMAWFSKYLRLRL